MRRVTIPYSPGYGDAVRAWLAYLWTVHRRGVVWFFVLVGVDVFVVLNGVRTWVLWVSAATSALLAALDLVPLAFRVLWAYKIKQLGIHQMDVDDMNITIHGVGVQVQSPLVLYSGSSESRRYFLLARASGPLSFSFIPKQHLSSDAVDGIRRILHEQISGTAERPPLTDAVGV